MIKIKNNAGKVIEVTKFAYDVIYKHRNGFTLVTDDSKHDEQTNESNKSNNQTDYSKLGWHELRKLASDKGVNVKGLKRDEIEDLLNKAGDSNDV